MKAQNVKISENAINANNVEAARELFYTLRYNAAILLDTLPYNEEHNTTANIAIEKIERLCSEAGLIGWDCINEGSIEVNGEEYIGGLPVAEVDYYHVISEQERETTNFEEYRQKHSDEYYNPWCDALYAYTDLLLRAIDAVEGASNDKKSTEEASCEGEGNVMTEEVLLSYEKKSRKPITSKERIAFTKINKGNYLVMMYYDALMQFVTTYHIIEAITITVEELSDIFYNIKKCHEKAKDYLGASLDMVEYIDAHTYIMCSPWGLRLHKEMRLTCAFDYAMEQIIILNKRIRMVLANN